jgi:hypothetical protein
VGEGDQALLSKFHGGGLGGRAGIGKDGLAAAKKMQLDRLDVSGTGGAGNIAVFQVALTRLSEGAKNACRVALTDENPFEQSPPCLRHGGQGAHAKRESGIARGSHCARWVLGQARVSPARTRACPRHLSVRAACANVPGIQGVRQGCTRLRCQRKHCLPCHGPAVCPEFDTRLLGITAGMRGSREGSGAKAAKSTRVVR